MNSGLLGMADLYAVAALVGAACTGVALLITTIRTNRTIKTAVAQGASLIVQGAETLSHTTDIKATVAEVNHAVNGQPAGTPTIQQNVEELRAASGPPTVEGEQPEGEHPDGLLPKVRKMLLLMEAQAK